MNGNGPVRSVAGTAWLPYLLGAAVVFLLLAARQLLDMRSPPLTWEDGTLFLTDALNHPFWENLITPFQGYLHAVPRIVAESASVDNLRSVPRIYRLIGLAIAACALSFPLAPIFRGRWTLTVRLTVTLLGALLPWHAETLGNITCLHWYLFYGLALLSLACPERLPVWTWLLLGGVAILTVFSSPLCVLCLPVLLVRVVREKKPRARRIFFGAVILLIAVMLAVVKGVLAPQEEVLPVLRPWSLGVFFIKTLGYSTGCMTALGEWDAQRWCQNAPACLIACAAIGALGLSGLLFKKDTAGSAWMGSLYYLLMPLFFTAVMRPFYVQHFAEANVYAGAGRYFLVPSLFLLLLVVVWLDAAARRYPNAVTKGALIVLICAYAAVIQRNFFYPAEGDYDWPRHIAAYEAAACTGATNEAFTVILNHDPPWMIRLPSPKQSFPGLKPADSL